MENIKDLRTIKQYAESTGYTDVRIRQFIADKRIEIQTIGDKIYIHKKAIILPSKAELKRVKIREAFEKSLRK